MSNDPSFYFVGQVASILGVNPRHISDLIYHRKIDCDKCVMVGNRRIIPADYVHEVEKALTEYGILFPKKK